MVELTTRIRRWGNSHGIIIPLEVLREKNLKIGEEVDVFVLKKGNVLRESFGGHKFSKSVDKLMREVDKELYDI